MIKHIYQNVQFKNTCEVENVRVDLTPKPDRMTAHTDRTQYRWRGDDVDRLGKT